MQHVYGDVIPHWPFDFSGNNAHESVLKAQSAYLLCSNLITSTA